MSSLTAKTIPPALASLVETDVLVLLKPLELEAV